MNEENESIPVVTGSVYNLMVHYLEQSTALLYLARENISLSEKLSSLCLNKWDAKKKPYRSLLKSQKALKVSLSEIDKLIKRVEWDCEEFYENSSVPNNVID